MLSDALCLSPLMRAMSPKLDEFGRIVYNEEVRPPPTAAGEGKPLFSKVDVSQFGFDSEEVRSMWCFNVRSSRVSPYCVQCA